MANSNLSLQWTVPGLLGESGQAAAPDVVWVQGNLTVMSRDVSMFHKKIKSHCGRAMAYAIS